MGISRLSLACVRAAGATGEGKGGPKPGAGHGCAPDFLGLRCRTGVLWEWGMAGSGGRTSLRARRRLGMASPSPGPFPPVWGHGQGGAAPPALPWSSKRGKSRAPTPPGAMREEGCTPSPPGGQFLDLPLCGALESPLWDPSALKHLSGHPSTREPHGTLWRAQLAGTAPRRGTVSRSQGTPLWLPPPPRLIQSSCHAFQRHFPKQTSRLFTGRQWS